MAFTGKELYRQMVIDFGLLGITTNLGMTLASVLMHESNDGKSTLAQSCNNYAGIIYIKQQGATPCNKNQPANEGGKGYAKYNSLMDCLRDFLRIMRLNRGGKGAPLSAIKTVQLINPQTGKYYDQTILDVPEMIRRMKANGYFQDSESNYYAGVKNKINMYATPVITSTLQDQLNKTASKEGKRFSPDVSFTEAVKTAFTEDIVNPVANATGVAGKYVLWSVVGLGALLILTRR